MTTDAKVFTPEQANRMLPLVRRIVTDILQAGQTLRAMSMQTQTGTQVREIESHEHRLEGLLRELEALGCAYKDFNFDLGLVDFPAVIDGRPALLCWRSDESAVLYYHGYQDGYVGRRPLPEGA